MENKQNTTWLDHFNKLPLTPFEKYGGFLLYFYVVLQCGFATYHLTDKVIFPSFNRLSLFVEHVFKTRFFTPFFIQLASSLPEVCVGILGLLFMNYYSTSSGLIIGSAFLSVVVLTGLPTLLSHDNIIISKVTFVREALILLLAILFYYIFAKSLPSVDDIKFGKALLILSLVVYVFYLLAVFITTKYSRELITQEFVDNKTPLNLSEPEVNKEGIEKIRSGMQYIRSPDYSEVAYSTSQWTEHWVDLYQDEILIRKDRSPQSRPLVTVDTSEIVSIMCDTLDDTLFDIYTSDHQCYGFRSKQRQEWIRNLNLVTEDITLRPNEVDWKEMIEWKPLTGKLYQGVSLFIFWPGILLCKLTVPFDLFYGSAVVSTFISILYFYIFGFVEVLICLRLEKVFGISADILGVSLICVIGIGLRHFAVGWNAGRKDCGNLSVLQGYSQAIFFMLVTLSVPWTIFVFVFKPVFVISSTFSGYVLEFFLGGLFILILVHLVLAIRSTQVSIGKWFGGVLLCVFLILFILVMIPPFKLGM
ncbi:hypothetical protein EIN_403730 [Entamoeba invadens IP1]|uniref:PH domain-containing protein n=1 Tax=Entamoeba invadens IP1 TaxID=370355 RepID=A0A0A1UCM0_ENTIV|nr:hypothetical protein EIN_403730 [Entamoeba invadens IP1]ELP90039.1 hypothetical protein EIN_403730 [Entamoeba invadens IP1]|eukprot:XP_004256810.1 hypothetical protein EIN_403730 [Entamoeba invadens IP1]